MSPLAPLAPVEESLDDSLVSLFAYMENARPVKTARVPIRRFDGAIPVTDAFINHWDVPGFFGDVRPMDIEPVDVSGIVNCEKNTININRVTTVPYRVLRHSGIPVRSKHCARIDFGFLDTGTGRWDSDYGYGQWVGPGEWLFSLAKNGSAPDFDEDISRTIQAAHGMALTFRYEWMVKIAFDGNAGVKLPTNPDGARELFKLRDIEPGRRRRSALKNWVREHTRVCKSGKVADIPTHLRGRSAFSWMGFDCEITPPPFDTERAAVPRHNKGRARYAGQ